MMSCTQCRKQMLAYLHNQLPPRRRLRVARHLNDCAACHQVYRQMRDFDGDLRDGFRHIGQPTVPQMAGIWQGIQAELRPQQAALLLPRFRIRYGLAVASLLLALLLPWTMNQQPVRALPLPPTPRQTSAVTYTAQVVALATPVGEAFRPASFARATAQAPVFAPNAAPQLEVTDAP